LTRGLIDIAIVGADDALGETMLELLAERRFPVGRLHALSASLEPDASVEFAGDTLGVESVHDFDFSSVSLVLFCASGATAAEHVNRALDAGARVIDASHRFRGDPAVPVVLPQVNGELVRAEGRVWAVPASAAAAVATVAAPLDAAFGLEWLGVVALYPVSASGAAGIRELAEQTRELFNQQSASPEIYSTRIAFNVLPLVDNLEESGSSLEERAIVEELPLILQSPALSVSATCLRVPVFYGLGVALTVTTRDPMAVEEVRQCLESAIGVRVVDDPEAVDLPAPATDAVSQDDVLVGRIRRSGDDDRRLELWLASDNLRLGQALPMVQLAEILVEKCLS
jgi:aspartate-semialdehyde dehydrogenase